MLANLTEANAIINPTAVVSRIIEHIIVIHMGRLLFQVGGKFEHRFQQRNVQMVGGVFSVGGWG
jgi:hypothetical protein